jgi:glycosyltransferase involved in cell wall biosynthesis
MKAHTIYSGAISNAFVTEGATVVWGDMLIGVDAAPFHEATVLTHYGSIERDGSLQAMRSNGTFIKMSEAGLLIEDPLLQDDSDELGFEQRMSRLSSFVARKNVLLLLEETPIDLLAGLDSDSMPPAIVNLYRSAEFKPPEHIQLLKQGFSSGLIQLSTVDSNASKQSYIDIGLSSSSIQVIHNGIDTDKFYFRAEGRQRVRKELGIDSDAPVILFVGRDSEEKDIPLLLKSASEYLQTGSSGHVIMVGAGLSADNQVLNSEIERFVDDRRRLHTLGVRSDLPDIYSASDVLALTSRTESRPLCINEAQAVGCSVAVVTDVGDAALMIDKHGFVSSRDEVEIANLWQEAFERRHEIGFPIERRDELSTARMVASYVKAIEQIAN